MSKIYVYQSPLNSILLGGSLTLRGTLAKRQITMDYYKRTIKRATFIKMYISLLINNYKKNYAYSSNNFELVLLSISSIYI